MKTICALLTIILLGGAEVWAQKKKITDSVDVIISLRERYPKNAPVDSVYVFFDRYNHTGAGIIKQVYYPKDNRILIPQVPPGKYYIGLYCMGAHQQFFSEVTFVNKRRKNNLRFKLHRSETFIPGSFIPPLANLDRLTVTDPDSFR